MKKTVKLIAICAIISVLAVGLCSCDRIDEMRAVHAKWNEDGESFTLGGEEYKYVGLSSMLSIPSIATRTVYITDADVPVLLSEDAGEHARYNMNYKVVEDNSKFYAAQDNYDYAKWVLSNQSKAMTNYGVHHYKSTDDGFVWEFCVVPRAVKSVLDETIRGMENEPESSIKGNAQHYIDLNVCDDKGMFLSYSNTYDIFKA